MQSSGIIYYHDWNYTPQIAPRAAHTPTRKQTPKTKPKPYHSAWTTTLGIGMVALALGGITGPLTPRIRLETKYAMLRVERALPAPQKALQTVFVHALTSLQALIQRNTGKPAGSVAVKPATPAVFDPLKTPDGASIDPVNKDFSLIVPKIGINAAVIPAVNPTKPGEYLAALQKGIAHSSLSYFPDEDGAVYLFSHSTNYDWFVGDLNAVFYLLKNLEENDTVLLIYKNVPYTYRITGKQVVQPTEVAYMAPQAGAKRLILQTCWPPGSTTERLLIFADLVEVAHDAI